MSDITVSMDDFHGATIKSLAMSAAIQRVRELHYKDEYGFCSECYWQSDCLIEEYPCRTLKALDGEQ